MAGYVGAVTRNMSCTIQFIRCIFNCKVLIKLVLLVHVHLDVRAGQELNRTGSMVCLGELHEVSQRPPEQFIDRPGTGGSGAPQVLRRL